MEGVKTTDKIIEGAVLGSTVLLDGSGAGVQYEGNAAVLRLTFDPGWDGFTKTVTFWNACGVSPVKRLLSEELLEDGDGERRVYRCPIPAEAMTEAGWLVFVIDGIAEGIRRRSAEGRLRVLSARWAPEAGDPADPTPTQAEQLQQQIDRLNLTASDAADAKFVPLREEWEEYADAMAAGVASYLCNMAPGTTDCVVGTPVQDAPFAAVYNDDYSVIYADLLTYDAIVGGKTTFGRYRTADWTPVETGNHDTVDIGGRRWPVLYMNCSGFVTLLTKGRDYTSSPYHLLFTDRNATPMQLAACCLEKGDTDEAAWTFDCHNALLTWRMAERMRASGCTPFPTASVGEGETVWNAAAFRKLRDGDILFQGNTELYGGRYLGIHHCMMYFADLERLNRAAAAYGVTLRACDGGSGAHGYMVHCSGSSDGAVCGTKNVLRIETLEHYLGSVAPGTQLWGVRASSNALNSAKLHQGITGRLVLHDCVVTNGWGHNAELDRIPVTSVEPVSEGDSRGVYSYLPYRYRQPASIVETGAHGERILDLRDYVGPEKSGVYCVWETGILLLGGPIGEGDVTPGSGTMDDPTNECFMLEVADVAGEDAYAIQRISTFYDKRPRVWERVINYNGNASLWREMADASHVLNMVLKALPNATASGAPAVFHDAVGGVPADAVQIHFPPAQSGSGDPSPVNARPITGYEECLLTASGNVYPIVEMLPADGNVSVGGGTLDVLSGELRQTWVRYVFDGTENWGAEYTASFYTSALRSVLPESFRQNLSGANGRLLCSHFPSKAANSGVTYENVWFSTGRYLNVQFPSIEHTGAAMQAWVREQYEKGTPLTVAICLDEPRTAYLLPRVVKTAEGDNTIDVSCGSVDVTYRTSPAAYIDKKLAALTAA